MSLKKLREKIEKNNDLFKKAKPLEKAVMIAQDCLDRIKLKQFTIAKGEYINSDYLYESFNVTDSVKEIINSNLDLPQCSMCAKGALFMCNIGRKNELSINQLWNEDDISSKSKDMFNIFGERNYHLIETAFEKTDINNSSEKSGISEDKISLAIEFGFSYINDEKRLKAICKNIIKNKGIFTP